MVLEEKPVRKRPFGRPCFEMGKCRRKDVKLLNGEPN